MTDPTRGRETLRPADRIRRRRDYGACYRRGRRVPGQFLELVVLTNPESDRARLGTTISRRVGNAVVRNRIRRQLKEWFRRHPDRHRWPVVDLVFHVRPGAGRSAAGAIGEEASRLVARAQTDRRSRR